MATLSAHLSAKVGALMARRAVVTQKALAVQAAALQTSMKSNHPFKDRTGQAEAGLFAVALAPRTIGKRQEFSIQAGYRNVPYGRRLEVDEGGKFGIVTPSMRTAFPRVSAAIHAARAAVR